MSASTPRVRKATTLSRASCQIKNIRFHLVALIESPVVSNIRKRPKKCFRAQRSSQFSFGKSVTHQTEAPKPFDRSQRRIGPAKKTKICELGVCIYDENTKASSSVACAHSEEEPSARPLSRSIWPDDTGKEKTTRGGA